MATSPQALGPLTVRFEGDAVQAGPAVTPYVHLVVAAGAVTEVVLASPSGSAFDVALRGLPAAWFTLGRCPPAVEDGQQREHLLVLHPPHAGDLSPAGDHDFTLTVTGDQGAIAQVLARLTLLPPLAGQTHSRYLDYLPSVYREADPGMGRLLLLFQSLLDPLEGLVDAADLSCSPDLAPERFLPWLARWVGAAPAAGTPVDRCALTQAPQLARWNGTRTALRERLRNALGTGVLMVENTNGLRLGQDAVLGVSTYLGSPTPHALTVTLTHPEGSTINVEHALDIIDHHKPAWVEHALRTVPVAGGTRG